MNFRYFPSRGEMVCPLEELEKFFIWPKELEDSDEEDVAPPERVKSRRIARIQSRVRKIWMNKELLIHFLEKEIFLFLLPKSSISHSPNSLIS
ncbi:hypothetical protein ES703_114122 [subsurface metagenome]